MNKEILTPYIKAEQTTWEAYALAKKHGRAKEVEAKRNAWLLAQACVVAVEQTLEALDGASK